MWFWVYLRVFLQAVPREGIVSMVIMVSFPQ